MEKQKRKEFVKR